MININNKQPVLRVESYFPVVANEVFERYFARLHAVPVPSRSPTIVRFENPEWFAEVFYLPTDGPRYCPRVAVGVMAEQFIDPRRNRIDVLHTVPEGNELQRYNFAWEYSSEEEARNAFTRVRDEIFDPYAIPYLSNPPMLGSLLRRRADELQRQWDEEIRQRNDSIAREAADAAFRARDYKSVVLHLSKIAESSLSPAELKKLNFARLRQ